MSDQTQTMDWLISEQTRATEQLKIDMAEQTRAIIREMMGTGRQKQPAQQQPIDLDVEGSGKKQTDSDVGNLLTKSVGR